MLPLLDAGVGQFVECGPGSVLAGLVKRIARGTPTVDSPLLRVLRQHSLFRQPELAVAPQMLRIFHTYNK